MSDAVGAQPLQDAEASSSFSRENERFRSAAILRRFPARYSQRPLHPLAKKHNSLLLRHHSWITVSTRIELKLR